VLSVWLLHELYESSKLTVELQGSSKAVVTSLALCRVATMLQRAATGPRDVLSAALVLVAVVLSAAQRKVYCSDSKLFSNLPHRAAPLHKHRQVLGAVLSSVLAAAELR
jgi:hypothetical protein